MPGELDGIGKWLEVGDGPLVAVGAAGADEVAQQVKMEADEDQDRGEHPACGWVRGWTAALDNRAEGENHQRASHQKRHKGADDRKGQGVQRMVILRKPQQGMRCVPCQEFGNDAKAVEIRGDCRGHHQRFFAASKRGGPAGWEGRGQHPSGKEVRDGTHGRSYFAADRPAKIRTTVTGAARVLSGYRGN